ncbi:hypothetical protein IAQ61_001705 [Plenodomus lingam]|uniref:C2 domain-containing protein n=1 Tax=Leptosphaeria maculans (strain JN3 / isolate v23.1.3 / race Av1-4-5-6-7-8) TaxID=985895 RepID=E4ZFY6_LEPMJ|nr:hypothetical protein LEMA_P063320.1 [Plenodomus lingam JN3]KAH9878433.1 hypothetical protein IAQ61_001705 [Plenodomus lingam]CBX90206.1 hypothetical protein LEMA_P063320.1 [Plenodomus lingam JN3]
MVEDKDARLLQGAHNAAQDGQNGQNGTVADKGPGKQGEFERTGGVPRAPQKTDTGGSTTSTTSTTGKKKGPEGGFDDTPVPRAPPGWTVKFTFHGASNLPLADINTLSADPFIIAQLSTALPTRHKEDPPLRVRTPTIRQNTNPQWNCEWIVANVPSSGFRLKCRIYDEDPADHDDRLGNVHVDVPAITEGWPGIQHQTYPIRKRMVSKRAWLLRAFAVCFGKAKHMTGTLTVSVDVLGRTAGDNGGRVYTVGPQFWIRHYSPLLGRLLGQKEPDLEGSSTSRRNGKQKPQKYNFQSNQMQLRGPVPEAMYHRYVEFKPFVKSMFTAKGVRGYLLSKALHHQHARVYNFDHATEYKVESEPSKRFTQKFLELVHYDQGGRIFTYVLTLDALFRFTETGKEFGIDMLSKHTMHSDVAAYVAYSGEFFIRRRRHPHRPPPEEEEQEEGGGGANNQSHPPPDHDNGPSSTSTSSSPNINKRRSHNSSRSDDARIRDPSYYELVIDNDSGTYRPNAKLLPQLHSFMSANFPGLSILTLDCQADAEKMAAMKDEQRERKKREGDHVVYTQISRTSSLSSSDEEELDRLELQGEMRAPHLRHQVQREAGARVHAVKEHVKDFTPRRNAEGWRRGGGPEKKGLGGGKGGGEDGGENPSK